MGAVTATLVDRRADFPVLEREINGHPLVYLDSAASSQKPRQVIETMERFYSYSYGTVHRGVYELGREATEQFEGARERIAAFLNWPADCSIFTRNATEAINLVAYAWGRENVSAGDEVLITEMEHHSNIVPWQLLCERTGARLVHVSSDAVSVASVSWVAASAQWPSNSPCWSNRSATEMRNPPRFRSHLSIR
jgi:selenocysteine lyase/cysteine desulfurase